MLSPGLWHKLVPKSRTANLRFRLKLLRLCRQSKRHREAIHEACRQDFLFWVNAFVLQYNPRKKAEGEVGPFITWDFQDDASLEMLRCIEEDDDLVIEKSREMGASWLCLLVILWLYLYHPWKKFLVISRSEAAVEDDDPDSLFWKLDFVLSYLPRWLLPKGWNAKQHRRKLYFGNPNGSTITGQASTGRAGVGGRATAMFIDEFSQIKEDFEVLHRTSDTTGCRIFNGTHRGTETAFNELCNRVDMKKAVMHWTQHPDKRPGLYKWDQKTNKAVILDPAHHYAPEFSFVQSEAPAGGPCPGLRSPWYDRECLRKGSPRAVAMDLDIDAGGSVSQFFNPVTLKVLRETYCCDPVWVGDLDYDAETGKPLGLVQREGGNLRLWVQPVLDGSKWRMPSSRYGVGGDLSTGTGATNSCLSMIDGRTGEKVGEYATPHMTPDRFAPLAVALCWLFKDEDGNPALFGWENAGPGLIFGKRVLEIGYPAIYWRESGGQSHGGKVTRQPGWYPSLDAKRLLLEAYRAGLDSRQCVNRSEWALKQCAPYRYNASGHPEHPSEASAEDHTGARVNHGDMTTADALAWKMVCGFGMIGPRKSVQNTQAPVGSLAWRRLIAGQTRRDDWDEPVHRTP